MRPKRPDCEVFEIPTFSTYQLHLFDTRTRARIWSKYKRGYRVTYTMDAREMVKLWRDGKQHCMSLLKIAMMVFDDRQAPTDGDYVLYAIGGRYDKVTWVKRGKQKRYIARGAYPVAFQLEVVETCQRRKRELGRIPYESIARQYGISKSTVFYWARNFGV